MTSKPGQKLIEHWRRQGLSLSSACDPQSVAEFERRNELALPDPVRDYFLSANGMKETSKDSEDTNGFSFWPLSRVVRAPDVTSNGPVRPVGDVKFFLFADYLQLSWTYACNFAPGSLGAVILIGRDIPERISDSFEEFVELYVSNSERLYKGTSWP